MSRMKNGEGGTNYVLINYPVRMSRWWKCCINLFPMFSRCSFLPPPQPSLLMEICGYPSVHRWLVVVVVRLLALWLNSMNVWYIPITSSRFVACLSVVRPSRTITDSGEQCTLTSNTLAIGNVYISRCRSFCMDARYHFIPQKPLLNDK